MRLTRCYCAKKSLTGPHLFLSHVSLRRKKKSFVNNLSWFCDGLRPDRLCSNISIMFNNTYVNLSLSLSFFLVLHVQHMEVSRLPVELELQLPTCTTATATWDQAGSGTNTEAQGLTHWERQVLDSTSSWSDLFPLLHNGNSIVNLILSTSVLCVCSLIS